MKTRLGKIIFAFLLLLPVCAQATNIDFYNDGQIVDGNHFDWVRVWDSATVSMTGGEVYAIYSYNFSHINLTGGLLTVVAAVDNGIIEMSGGTVNSVNLYDSSIMYLSGGNIDDVTFSVSDDAVLHVYGKDFLYTRGGGYGYGWLSGHWADGSEFSILFRSLPESFPPSSSVILHIIPEPCTFGLVGFGFFIVRRNMTAFRK